MRLSCSFSSSVNPFLLILVDRSKIPFLILGSLSFSLRNYEDRSINTAIESRQVDFKMLKEEIRNYNKRRKMRRGL